ncbi:MAG: DUF501 domain-containing protein [Actinomycetaceae bacterium]|nr:DUF501 domain-containing protein [Actinomycetaceae bacterium]
MLNLTKATPQDIAALKHQLGRVPRGVVGISARCMCGKPLVVATAPVLPGGEPFPTTFYLTHPALVKAASRLEAEHVMETYQDQLADPEVAEKYAAAHHQYLQARAEVARAAGTGEPEAIAGITAGGMPTRVKCLHALIGHSLSVGPGVNPVGDMALSEVGARGWWDKARCYCA